MLKKCYGLFLGLVVLAGSACVTPTHASSASVIIVSIRAGTTNSATEEKVVLYNNSSFEQNVTGWCLTNKTQNALACFNTASNNEKIFLPAYSYATVVSTIAANNEPLNYSLVYEPASNSSGSIVASSDTISLVDENNQLIDQHSWSSSVSSTQFWLRIKLSILPDLFVDTNASIDWQKVSTGEVLMNQIEYREEVPEIPIEESPDTEQPTQPAQPVTVLPAIITELLPNAIGSDTGNEFIEIFNPNLQSTISLAGYKLAVGQSLEKGIVLDEYILQPSEYKILSNAEYSYTLLNTSSRVALTTAQGVLSSEVPAYNSPQDGMSWALINGIWQYTNQPTPGYTNLPNVLNNNINPEDVNEDTNTTTSASTLKPCASNQYRSPETNRCRLIASESTSAIAVCKVGQERNPETNRCKNIASTSTPAPCKEGQERNPETNRCRNIKQITKADFAVKGATNQVQAGTNWYVWAAIAGVVLLVIGYGVWEWRGELKKVYNRIKAKFAGSAN